MTGQDHARAAKQFCEERTQALFPPNMALARQVTNRRLAEEILRERSSRS